MTQIIIIAQDCIANLATASRFVSQKTEIDSDQNNYKGLHRQFGNGIQICQSKDSRKLILKQKKCEFDRYIHYFLHFSRACVVRFRQLTVSISLVSRCDCL